MCHEVIPLGDYVQPLRGKSRLSRNGAKEVDQDQRYTRQARSKTAGVHRNIPMQRQPPCDITMSPASRAHAPDHCSSILAFAAHDENFARISIAAFAATRRSISPTDLMSRGRVRRARSSPAAGKTGPAFFQ
jgi:hypothetical protein